ncbi:xaa-Pro aminopeptidase, partial [Thraustotheca clavata]
MLDDILGSKLQDNVVQLSAFRLEKVIKRFATSDVMSATLASLRRSMQRLSLRVLDKDLQLHAGGSVHVAGLLVESEDAHGSEYVSDRNKRRAFVSGFTGSAGTALITMDKALLWTDGRYFLQAEQELSEEWTLMKMAQKDVPTLEEWLEANFKSGEALAIDPLLTSVTTARNLVKALGKVKAAVVCTEWQENLVDQVWENQPAHELSNVFALNLDYSGASIAQKLTNLRAEMKKKKSNAMVLTALDDIAWLFNIRASDVACNPVVTSYAFITMDKATLCMDAKELTSELLAHFGDEVQVKAYSDIVSEIESYASNCNEGDQILVDPSQCNVAVFSAIPFALRKELPSIVMKQKAIKNEVEIEGMRQAHIRDGAALVKFFSWLEQQLDAGSELTEVSVARVQKSFREEMDKYVSLSFETISGSGPNGSIIHYDPKEETCASVTKDKMYLNDSGAQYLDGTTDVTRTMHFGEPTEYEIHCFTHVLKAHIALATAVFPNEIDGVKLDAITRAPLWRAGLDYRHGTGHGVGAFLNVHEKGVLMSFKLNPNGLPISESMIVSNEPGYYEDGQFGIRIESLMVARKADEVPTHFGHFCTFETITMCPIQRRLIDTSLLTAEELDWLNAYHATVQLEHQSSMSLQEPLLPKPCSVQAATSPDKEHSRIILARLRATGRVATDGLASEYADTFTPPLQKLMSEDEFQAAIYAINQTCYDYFPCTTCVVYAYFGAFLTCGLLLCCSRPCTGEVEENLLLVLQRINNKETFRVHGVQWELKRTRCHSWIEISQ